MQHVVAAYRQAVAITGYDPDIEVRIGEFEAGGDCRCTAVNRMEAVTFNVIGKPRSAANSGDKRGVVRIGADIGKCFRNGLQDRIVTTTRAPADFLGRFVIFCS